MFRKIIACIVMLPIVAMSAEQLPMNIWRPIPSSYSAKYSWQESDILEAIEDDLVISNNYESIIACFTLSGNPLYTWDLSVKKNILQRLCSLLKIDKTEEDKYIEQLLAADENNEAPIHSTSCNKPSNDYPATKICSSDIILNLYQQLHLRRFDPTKNRGAIPSLKQYPIFCPATPKSKLPSRFFFPTNTRKKQE